MSVFYRKFVDFHIILYVIFDKSIARKPTKETPSDIKKTPAVQTQLYHRGVRILDRRKY